MEMLKQKKFPFQNPNNNTLPTITKPSHADIYACILQDHPEILEKAKQEHEFFCNKYGF